MIRNAALFAALILGLAAPQIAHAQRLGEAVGPAAAQQQQAARRGVEAGRVLPPGQILSIINRRTPGRHLDFGMDEAGGRQVYRVRWMTNDGRRIDYVVDAQTGSILSANGG